MGLLDTFTDQLKEAFTFDMPNDTKLAEDGVPIIKSPKKIDSYPIVQDASTIRRQALYLISYYERVNNDTGSARMAVDVSRDVALVAKIGRCFEAWRGLDADGYQAFFTSLSPGQLLSQFKVMQFQSGVSVVADECCSYVRTIFGHVDLNSAARKERILTEIKSHYQSTGVACKYTNSHPVVMEFFDRVVTSFRNENPEDFDRWRKTITLTDSMALSTNNMSQHELCTKLFELMWIPEDEAERTKFNRVLAEHYRAGYGNFSRAVDSFRKAGAYLRAEAKKVPIAAVDGTMRCDACGASIMKVDSSCVFCGCEIVRKGETSKSRISLDRLLPVCVSGDTCDILSFEDSLHNVKQMKIDGTFDDDLDVLSELVAWYKAKKENIMRWTQGQSLLSELEAFMDGQWTSMSRKARRDDGRERDLVRLVVRWRRDCLGESVSLGIGGLFAGADKKKKAFEAKVREELGF